MFVFIFIMTGTRMGYPGFNGSFIVLSAAQTSDYRVDATTPATIPKFQAEIRG